MGSSKDLGVWILALILINVLALSTARFGIGGYRMMQVVSNSMQPGIQKGDYVLCKRIKSPEDIEIGNIYCYDRGDKTIFHRLVDIEDGYYIFKGDNNILDDGKDVVYDQVTYEYKYTLFNFELLLAWR